MKTGMPSPGPDTLTVKISADNYFATLFPNDARYAVAEWDVILVRGKRPVATNKFYSESGSLSNFKSTAQPMDRILVEVRRINRTNFVNKTEDVHMEDENLLFNIPLN
jgi:hypothetical protein